MRRFDTRHRLLKRCHQPIVQPIVTSGGRTDRERAARRSSRRSLRVVLAWSRTDRLPEAKSGVRAESNCAFADALVGRADAELRER